MQFNLQLGLAPFDFQVATFTCQQQGFWRFDRDRDLDLYLALLLLPFVCFKFGSQFTLIECLASFDSPELKSCYSTRTTA